MDRPLTASAAGIHAKLERALLHAEHVESKIKSFATKKPFGVRIYKEVQDGNPVTHLSFTKNHLAGTPDVELMLLAGESLHQMRSALDHLISQLVIASGRADLLATNRRHQFPIFRSGLQFANKNPVTLEGVRPDLQDRLERFQPYNMPVGDSEENPLWRLQELNNTDKHRIIPTSLLVPSSGYVWLDGDPLRHFLSNDEVIPEDGKVFMTFPCGVTRVDLHFDLLFEQFPTVSGSYRSIPDQLRLMHSEVHDVVRGFNDVVPA